jgi:hypothetical protein
LTSSHVEFADLVGLMHIWIAIAYLGAFDVNSTVFHRICRIAQTSLNFAGLYRFDRLVTVFMEFVDVDRFLAMLMNISGFV